MQAEQVRFEQLNLRAVQREADNQAAVRALQASLRQEGERCEQLRHFIATIKEDMAKLTAVEDLKAKELALLASVKNDQVRSQSALKNTFLFTSFIFQYFIIVTNMLFLITAGKRERHRVESEDIVFGRRAG